PVPPGKTTASWSKLSGPGTVTFSAPTSPNTSATFSASGTYVLRLSATDSALQSTSDVTVRVVENTAPVISPVANQTIVLPSNAQLQATVTDAGLPTPPGQVTLAWSKVSGPGTAAFSAPNSAITTATFSLAGVYVVRPTATDSALQASTDVTITVLENKAPVV